ncbi:MAG: formylglycine-generating enzyme family protein [Kiritimatiellia bacterium]|jgi:formylglycine-generating enzyme required for sulfatase activity
MAKSRYIPLLVAVCCCAFGISEETERSKGLEDSALIKLSPKEAIEFVWISELDVWVGKYEVTLGQFIHMSRRAAKYPHEFAGRFVENGDEMNAPAVMVGWKEANDACRFLNRQYGHLLRDGYIFRLPTESEWDEIARCGDDRIYPWGNDWPPVPMADGILPNLQGVEVISISGRTPPAIRSIPGYSDGWPSVAPVKHSGANDWGVFGLAGNVQEWCEGWYDRGRGLRLLKGSSAGSFQPVDCKITARHAVEGQSTFRGLFLWGEVRNQGRSYTGFRIVVGQPIIR